MSIQIGDLDERIKVYKLVRGADDGAGGNVSSSWVFVDELWAKIEPGSGKEMKFVDQMTVVVDFKVTVRRRNDITAAMKIMWGDKELAVIGTPRQPVKGFWTVIHAQEGTAS